MRSLERDVRGVQSGSLVADPAGVVQSAQGLPVICTRSGVGQYLLRFPTLQRVSGVSVTPYNGQCTIAAQVTGNTVALYGNLYTGAATDIGFNASVTGR